MMRIVLVALLSGLGVTSALAADLAARPYTKAPPPAVASVYSWTGFYVGLNAGAVFSRSAFDMTASNFFTAAAQICADGTTRLDRTGFTGGGQAGYNWQSGQFVVGVEADINYTDGAPALRSRGPPRLDCRMATRCSKVRDRTGCSRCGPALASRLAMPCST